MDLKARGFKGRNDQLMSKAHNHLKEYQGIIQDASQVLIRMRGYSLGPIKDDCCIMDHPSLVSCNFGCLMEEQSGLSCRSGYCKSTDCSIQG